MDDRIYAKISTTLEEVAYNKSTPLSALDPLLPHLVKLYEEDLDVHKDYRYGKDIYGYGDENSIRGQLECIEDRWNAPHRIRWLINLIDPDYYPYKDFYKNKKQAEKAFKKIPNATWR